MGSRILSERRVIRHVRLSPFCVMVAQLYHHRMFRGVHFPRKGGCRSTFATPRVLRQMGGTTYITRPLCRCQLHSKDVVRTTMALGGLRRIRTGCTLFRCAVGCQGCSRTYLRCAIAGHVFHGLGEGLSRRRHGDRRIRRTTTYITGTGSRLDHTNNFALHGRLRATLYVLGPG